MQIEMKKTTGTPRTTSSKYTSRMISLTLNFYGILSLGGNAMIGIFIQDITQPGLQLK